MLTRIFGPLQYAAGLAYRVTGTGPTLVLLHGGSGSRNHWTRNVPGLAPHVRVVTLDLPGFGESSAPPEDMEAPDYLDWVADSLQAFLGQTPVFHLAGFSFGSAVTAAVAAILARRGRPPAAFSLVSPAGFGRPVGRTVQLERIDRGPEASEASIRAATARNLGRWMLSREPLADDPAVDMHLQNLARARFDSPQIRYRVSLLQHLQAAGRPAQVLLGTADPLIFPSLAARQSALQQAAPDMRVDTILGAGHWLPYEAPDAVNDALLTFHLRGDPHAV